MTWDPYVYPGTTILKNVLDIRDQNELNQIEADVVSIRFLDVLRRRMPGALNPKWYRSVHKRLFEDLYPEWAGTFRSIDISKANEIFYAKAAFLEDNANKIFKDLHTSKGLFNSELPIFIERLSALMADLHVLHPFRDGNTRTLQVATTEIARRSGYSIAWERADPTKIITAGTAAALGDTKPYCDIISVIVAIS